MTPKVEFHFDFGSPNSYFSHKVIPGIEQRTGAKFDYLPVLLGGVFKLTNNQPPMVQFKGIKNKPEYQRLEMERFIRKHGLTRFRMNPNFPVNTVQIMRGAVAAEMDGNLAKYVDAVFAHMWEDGLKMDDAEVIRAALDKAGLDGAQTLARIQDQAVKDKLLANTEASVARGTFGSPTFFVGTEIFFGKDRLRDVEEEIQAQKKAA
ncbi:2-hydroxychromene-2-carboxylate isomerase [Desertibaculum subflavum]|uniref:2-hydroxychromene-2-carboxylate isomerase n=1 Tax=Desertibaculum subflavum TaxID=2268458 RepID=UPI000E676673